MSTVNRRLIAFGAAGAVALAGGGVAYAAAADSGGSEHDKLIDRAAAELNVSPERLRSALADAMGAQLDRAVADGRLTQKQADRMKELARDGGPLPGGPPRVHRVHAGGPLDGAADYLGLDEAELRERLADGRSLAEIARAEGKSVDGLKQALVAAAKKGFDRAVEEGHLTEGQRDELLDELEQRVRELVNAKGTAACGPGGPGGPGAFGGPGPGGHGRPEPPSGREDGSGSGPSTTPGAWDGAPGAAPARVRDWS